MKKKYLYIVLIIIGLFVYNYSYADDISLNASVDKNEITVGSEIYLTINISGRASSFPEPKIPQLKEFTIYSQGNSRSVSIVNGAISSAVVYNYILVSKKEGDFSFGPIVLNFNNKQYKSQVFNLKVHPAKSAADQGSLADDNTNRQTKEERREAPKDIFIETRVDKKEPYLNEQVIMTFLFYQAVNLSENPEYIPPATTGFWVEELPPPKRYYKVINGRQYLVTEIYTALFPTASGEQVVGSAEVKCVLDDIIEDPFSFFARGTRRPVNLKSKAIKLNVKSLPQEKMPVEFKGAIGSFTLNASIDKNSVKEGDPITLKIVINGTGNIKTIPDIELPPEMDNFFKKYKSNSSVNIVKKDYNVHGEKVFEFILVPVKSGEINIPSIKFVYFSPSVKKYITSETPLFKLNILPGQKSNDKEETESYFPSISQEDIKRLGKDIRYIKVNPKTVANSTEYYYSNPLFLVLQIFPLFLLIGIISYRKKSERLENDVVYARSKKAHKLAKAKIKELAKYLDEGKTKEFYAELARVIQNYLGDKFNLPPASVTQQIARNILFEKGINDCAINNVIDCMNKCDMIRFAPSKSNLDEMKSVYKIVEEIIVSIEDHIR